MSLLRVTGKLLLNSRPLFKFQPSARGAIILDKDWMPGPYPRTESERLAAAKKYNLLPEEYQAYDPDKWEFAYGDYPQLPNRDFESKDPYYAWDYNSIYHNYGETFHANYVLYGPTGVSVEHDMPPLRSILGFYFVACLFMYIWCYVHEYTLETITIFKLPHRVYPGETYYHYPNSNLAVYK